MGFIRGILLLILDRPKVWLACGSVLLGLMGPACEGITAQPAPSAEWKTYHAPDGSYAIEYPGNWEYSEVDASEAGIPPELQLEQAVVFSSGGLHGAGGAAFQILGGEVEQSSLRFAIFVLGQPIDETPQRSAEIIRTISTGTEGYRELKFEPISSNGSVGFDYAYRWSGKTTSGDDADATTEIAFFEARGRAFLLTASAFTSTFEEESATVARFMKSLRLSQ